MQCTGKKTFDDRRIAEQHVSRLHRHGYLGHVYRCTLCGLLHVGRKRKHVRRGVGRMRTPLAT